MEACPQTATQNVYQHGASVQKRTLELFDYIDGKDLIGNWNLPDWFDYKTQIKTKLFPIDIVKEYTLFHDCGKPYCITYDESGRKHFPNHAEVSYQTWLSVGGSAEAAALIRMDMMVHQMKAVDVEEFVKHKEAMTLLIVGLAEVHSNAEMFGGLESESFKIKWNQINKRGKAICKKLFGDIK